MYPLLFAQLGSYSEVIYHLRVLTFVILVCGGAILTVVMNMALKRRSALKSLNSMVTLASRAADLPTFRSALTQLSHEMERARRYERPFRVLVLGFTPAARELLTSKYTGPQDVALHELILRFPLLGCVLRDSLRGSDVIAYDALVNRYLIGLVEINAEQAAGLQHRFLATAQRSSLPELRMGVATFPQDGLTLEDLISVAQERCDGSTEQSASARSNVA